MVGLDVQTLTNAFFKSLWSRKRFVAKRLVPA